MQQCTLTRGDFEIVATDIIAQNEIYALVLFAWGRLSLRSKRWWTDANIKPKGKKESKEKEWGATRGLPRRSPIQVLIPPKHA